VPAERREAPASIIEPRAMSRHDDSRATSEERSSLGLRVARKAGGASLVVAAVLLLFVVGGSLAAWTFSTEPPGAQTVNSAVLQSPYEATGGPVSAALPPAGTWNAPAQLQGSDVVEGVSCPDAGMCWAVGYGGPSTSTDALVAQWNAGSGWGTPFTPQGVSSSDSTLGAVSCPTPGLCWAVGSDSDGGFAVEWAPASGWQQPVPLPHLFFNAVSCPDAAMCFASGSETGSTGLLVGAVISWTSSSGWGTPQTVQGSSVLDSIACPSTTACFAVGQAFAGSSIEDVAASWEAGSGWGSATALSSSDILNAVACPSSSMCLAVGESTSATPSGVAVE
jgi:hypothetical protein